MATFGPPLVNTANLADGAVTSAKIALDTIAAVDVAANAIGDSEIAAHTTTKITSPFSLVTGTVPVNQGGTGQTTAQAALNALIGSSTQGDVLYYNGTNWVVLNIGSSGLFLKSNGAGQNPSWAAAGSSHAAGEASRTLNSADNTDTYAHGLSGTPSYVRVVAMSCTTDGAAVTEAIIVGGTTRKVFMGEKQSSQANIGNTFRIVDAANTTSYVTGTVTVDGTNISIAWVKTGTLTTTAHIVWHAML